MTAEYRRGAEEALRLLDFFHAEGAVLKERSPSCGKGVIYDGSFSGALTEGDGVFARAASGARRSRVRGIRHPRPAGKSMNFTIPIPF